RARAGDPNPRRVRRTLATRRRQPAAGRSGQHRRLLQDLDPDRRIGHQATGDHLAHPRREPLHDGTRTAPHLRATLVTQTDNNNARDSNDTRRTILVIALLVLGVLVLLLAVPDRGPVVIDAETGGLAIVTDDTVDLV